MNSLRLMLEYASNTYFINTIGFGLRNIRNKTAFDLAIDSRNYEAIYLLNHYEFNEINSKLYPVLKIEDEFETMIKPKLQRLADLKDTKKGESNVIRNLIFEGGGIKGIAYVSALKESIESNVFQLENIKRIGGTSAGAITSVLLGVGYSPNGIRDVLDVLKFEDFLDSDNKNFILKFKNEITKNNFSYLILSNLINIGKIYVKDFTKEGKYGLFPGEKFREWIDEKIFEKLNIKYATFKEIQSLIEEIELKKEFDLKYLFLVGSDLSTGKCEIFSHLNTPNMIISDAVRISMSIPIIFNPHRFYIKNEHGERIVRGNSLYVDGGLLNNNPINMFDFSCDLIRWNLSKWF